MWRQLVSGHINQHTHYLIFSFPPLFLSLLQSIKIHDLSDLKGVYTIIDVDEEKGMYVSIVLQVRLIAIVRTYYVHTNAYTYTQMSLEGLFPAIFCCLTLGQLDKLHWTDDGQLLSVSTTNGEPL